MLNDWMIPADKQVVDDETRKALETTDPHYSNQVEHRIIFADGETGYVAVRIFIVKDDQGRTVRTYGVNQDISERKRMEKALRRAKAGRSKSNAAVGDGYHSGPHLLER